MGAEVAVFGIRHHGPGSARSLVRALHAFEPEAVLVEGPPDADALIALAASPAMRPPVALLVYDAAAPSDASFYPFARFSPEWQAIRYGLERGVPVRFMDLPVAHRIALERAEHPEHDPEADAEATDHPPPLRDDPLGHLARAAGFSDGERWWEQTFEQRADTDDDSAAVFRAVLDAMRALRETSPPGGGDAGDTLGLLREAHMRRVLRQASKEHARVAVVCGAWHAPALADPGSASADNALLKGLPKVKAEAAWIPWTHRRLSVTSGYGAGVRSPGWYDHLWRRRDAITESWLTRAARLMRDEGLDASSAHVIETVRLAEALAAMRGRSAPGLDELTDAAGAALCEGDPAPAALIHDRLIVGDRLGRVPDEAPAVPLQRDLTALVRRLRLRQTADEILLDLDLRQPIALERSHLLHRLGVLAIPWGEPVEARGKSGTFHEFWRLRWHPEFAVRVVEAAPWGNTVESAATGRVIDLARQSESLAELTSLMDHVLLGDLPEATRALADAVRDRAAVEHDTARLMDALPPLAGVRRYGNVRNTDAELVAGLVSGLATRVTVGLPGACASLDEEAAEAMAARVRAVHAAMAGLPEREAWHGALHAVAHGPQSGEVVAGTACRLLLDAGALGPEAAAALLSFSLSRAAEPARAAAWVEGFLAGSGAVLLHDERLWSIVDRWVASLGADHFDETVPLLRRTFARFAPAERRMMGEKARAGTGHAGPPPAGSVPAPFDHERAARGVGVVTLILEAAKGTP